MSNARKISQKGYYESMLSLILAICSVIALWMNIDFEAHLKEILASSSSYTGRIGQYILDSGGKRLRPKIVGLLGSAIGLPQSAFMPFAYTVELMHTASLLHDDVVDGTEIRRSRPTANQIFGDKPALLAGDFISASAMETMCALGDMRLAMSVVQTIKKMSEGELMELEYSHSFHDSKEVYLKIIYLKTASLFELCSVGTGIIAGLSEKALDALASFGRLVGMGFQIVDDIINVSPDESDNKDAFNDILEGKSTLPLVILFKKRPEVLKKTATFSSYEEKKDYIVSKLDTEILRTSRAIAQEYLDKSIQTLHESGYLTKELSDIPHQIIAQVETRF
jgi:octaprenyl-diphosphate synthase